MASTFSICGFCVLKIASTRLTTSRVRVTDWRPSGSWTKTKNAPWSSSGTKPVGVPRTDEQADGAAADAEHQQTARPWRPAPGRVTIRA